MSLLTRIVDAAGAGLGAAFDTWTGATGAKSVSTTSHLHVIAQPAPPTERDPAVLGNRLTPALLAALIAQRNQGWMQPWIDLGGEFLQKNPHLVSQLAIRRESVVETRFEVRVGRGTSSLAASKAADACGAMLNAWQSRPTHAWSDLVAHLTSALWWQRSVHEVMWARDGRELRLDHLVAVHPRRLSLAAPPGEPDATALRLHDPDDPESPFSGPYGVPLSRFHADKFLVHTASPLGLQPTCDGLFAAAVWYLLMYEWSWRDLMALIELLGRPAHIGYYAAGGARAAHPTPGVAKLDGVRMATDAEVDKLRRVVMGISGSLRDVLADTTRVEPLRYDHDVTPLQRETLEHLERLLSKLVNGADSISDLRPGARAAQEVMYAQSFTFWRSDVRRVCAAVSWLFARYVAANPRLFPEGTPAPELWSPELDAARDRLASPRTNP